MIRVDETDPVGEIEPSFPYRDVLVRRGVEFKDNYDIQSEIGRGKFGTVYLCKEKTSGLQLAAKVVTTTRKEDRLSVEREVEIMRRLQHPRLIQLYDSIDTGKQIYVILELIQGGELFERVIDDDFVLTERSCAVFMRQICEGIEFVHAQHILHLDMKPENIMCLTKEGNRIKIIDFGLARHYDPRRKMQVLFGTPEFVAPEVVNFDQIGFGTDMWSIGVICYVLLSGLSPFMGDTDVETMANVTIAKYDFDHDAFINISEDAKEFIKCLLVKDKEKRATATQCRSHRWLLPFKSPLPKKLVAEERTPAIETKPESLQGKKKKKRITTATTAAKHQPEVLRAALASTSNIGSANKDQLDVTKDNLRLFVERWREHPDSPYALEEEDSQQPTRWGDCEAVNGRADNNSELISLRGQSPSPCGSVCSSQPSEFSGSLADKRNNSLAVPNGMLWGLERRASEGNSAESGHRRDQAAQIVLAEEIIKLSEHLRNLAMAKHEEQAAGTAVSGVIKTHGADRTNEGRNGARRKSDQRNSNNNEDYNEQSETVQNKKLMIVNEEMTKHETSPGEIMESNENRDSNEIWEKLSSITRQRKINGTTFNGSRCYEKQDSNVTNFSLKKCSAAESSRNPPEMLVKPSFLGDSSTKLALAPEGNVRNSTDSQPSMKDKSNRVAWEANLEDDDRVRMDDYSMKKNREIDLTPPWRRARTKHRFGETCRDVPRISNLRDIHKSLNLDEPKSTKDLLLHLLGEWDDSTRAVGVGRKSVSVDWCGEESIARRSMNSLAEYFQSEQQKSTTTDMTTNSSAPSIHR